MKLATEGVAVAPMPLVPARAEWSLGTLWLLIGFFTLLRLVLAAAVPLLPEEAYYWTWSRYPAASYFDHPPLASYAIAATTAVLGSSAFAVKLAAVLWSIGWNVLWMRLLLDAYRDVRRTAWTLIALNLTIVYEALGVGATPDGPLLFCLDRSDLGSHPAGRHRRAAHGGMPSGCSPAWPASASTPAHCFSSWPACSWSPLLPSANGCFAPSRTLPC